MRRLMSVFVVWWAAFTACYLLRPGWHTVTWAAIGLASSAAILIGVRLHRPSRRLPWVLLAIANFAFTIGDTTYNVIKAVTGEPNPFPSLADVFYLVTYPLFAAGLVVFIRCRSVERDWGALLDALTLTSGMALLAWIYLIEPNTSQDGATWIQKAISIAYPLGDVLMLAMLARLIAIGHVRSPSVKLLTVGTLGILVSDVLYGLGQINNTWQVGTPQDLGWVVFYAAWGLSALHPTMVGLTEPVPPRRGGIPGRRVAVLALASLIAPGVLLYQALQGDVTDGGVIAVFSTVLFLLVLARLATLVGIHRRAVTRERALRTSAASLVAAVRVEEIARTVRTTVTSLFTAGERHEAVLALGDRRALRPVAVRGAGPIGSAAELGGDWLRSLAPDGSRLARTAELGIAEPRAGRPGPEQVLLCPLVLKDLPPDEALIGVLLVAGRRRSLVELREVLEGLAAQAALTVSRVSLVEEITRRDSEAYFRTLVHNASDVILILDDDDTIRYASPSAAAVFGAGALDGKPALPEVVHPADSRQAARALAAMRRNGRGQEAEAENWRLVHTDGRTLELEVRCSNLRQDPSVHGLVLTLRDMTEQRQLERELTHRAFHDALTGLPNRLLLLHRVEEALAERAGDADGVVCVFFIDLDDFKVVNDTMGHTKGDELLSRVARRLSRMLPSGDTLARIGGDEFVVLSEHLSGMDEAQARAEELVRAFSRPFVLDGEPVSVSASVGIGSGLDSSDGEELIGHADLALYRAKAAGKHAWRRYQPWLQTAMIERHELRMSLDEAIANEAFTLLYQPIVDLATGRITGAEALARWPHARQGLVLPERFIALAEETGHIKPLGAWVLRQAAEDAARWQRGQWSDVPMAVNVNVSARQFRDPAFVDEVSRVLDESGLRPGSLVLELTESVLMRRNEQARADMRRLKDLGVRVAIDDFGTGFSSLGYLRDFPIDVLKVDKSFIDGIAVDAQQVALVEGIVGIARTLGLLVIAEGIEDVRQQDLLARMGCQYGQGFLFSKPVTAEACANLVRDPDVSEHRLVGARAASAGSAGPAGRAAPARGAGSDATAAGRTAGSAPHPSAASRGPATPTQPAPAGEEADMADVSHARSTVRRDPRWGDLERLRQANPMSDAVIDEIRGRRIRCGDHWLADFASCNYLGFDLEPEIMDSIEPQVRRWGTHPSWSRLLGSPSLYPQIEERLTALLGAPDSLVLPTITLIHASVIPVLAGTGRILVDKEAHRTVYDGCMVARSQGASVSRCRTSDLEEVERQLRATPPTQSRMVCIDGVNSMTGNLADLPLLAEVCRRHGALLYVDDAHGFGVIGEADPAGRSPYGLRGNSIVRHLGESYDDIVLVGGFSKAYSSLLAFLALPTWLKEHLKVAAAPYLYSGPSPTASLATVLSGMEVNDRRGDAIRADLARKTARVLSHLAGLGVHTPNTSGLPIVEVPLARSTDLDAVGRFLWESGIYVTLAAYPLVPRDRVGFRIQVTAANTDEEITTLTEVLTTLSARFQLRPEM
ncbi:aminotransferase class I/II-fold pyridoxal phosphate-dependent enzyme [Kitasatospora sp. NPDC058965]|uniref:aminotransferase class I/II-fold pyridoxal phosphate-dependent enzyme n=1 Tax=Kitasatospora sp. NPDC058965 TaxID=3346682 RepID=UPI0036BFD846